MNEHIKKLVDQAFDESQHPGGFGLNFEKFQEKFAELIVRECIDTVSDCSVEYCTRPQIVSEIKEHFGVEE
jgi:hypothetical protein